MKKWTNVPHILDSDVYGIAFLGNILVITRLLSILNRVININGKSFLYLFHEKQKCEAKSPPPPHPPHIKYCNGGFFRDDPSQDLWSKITGNVHDTSKEMTDPLRQCSQYAGEIWKRSFLFLRLPIIQRFFRKCSSNRKNSKRTALWKPNVLTTMTSR